VWFHVSEIDRHKVWKERLPSCTPLFRKTIQLLSILRKFQITRRCVRKHRRVEGLTFVSSALSFLFVVAMFWESSIKHTLPLLLPTATSCPFSWSFMLRRGSSQTCNTKATRNPLGRQNIFAAISKSIAFRGKKWKPAIASSKSYSQKCFRMIRKRYLPVKKLSAFRKRQSPNLATLHGSRRRRSLWNTLIARTGACCCCKMSHISICPSMRAVKNVERRVGLQQPVVSGELAYLHKHSPFQPPTTISNFI